MNGFVKSVLTLALTLCACGTAYAHAHLLQSAPTADAVVTAAPDVLRLDFSEGIQLGFTGVTLHGPDGGIASTGHARLAPKDDKEVLVPLPWVLTKGKYTVEWHALSKDGHTTRGSYGFSVAQLTHLSLQWRWTASRSTAHWL
jgi:methionine-rich copper-binding protein CopC